MIESGMDNKREALLRSVLNSKKDLVVIFEEGKPCLTNTAFNKFFGVSSLEQYSADFGPFVRNFVPHPSYFNQDKIAQGETWFEAIMRQEEQERVVSMMNSGFEPHAFAVHVDSDVENFKIVSFEDITQTLIKRIMIQNNATTDHESGAYSKNYFTQIMHSFDDAAAFNEKIIGVSFFDILSNDGAEVALEDETLKAFVEHFKRSLRHDDMLVRWGSNSFLLVYLVEDTAKAKQVEQKLHAMAEKKVVSGLKCHFSHTVQKEKQSIAKLIKSREL
jgi:GGDEF domain-containing protein